MATFYINQHGCAKNQTDGELICSFLEQAGHTFTQQPDNADYIIINSCGFIQSAKKESIDSVYSIKAAYPKARIIMAGCLAQRYAQELNESMPELDGIFGNGDLSKIAAYINQMEDGKKHAPDIYTQEGVCQGPREVLFNYKGSAYIKITEGCSNHCSFCAIPLIRGEVRSRPVKSIVQEIKELIAHGVYEINLIGQDLAAFCDQDKNDLASLLKSISKLKGTFIVRTLYIHPDHFNTNILEVFQNDKRFVPYFDIPFQSGDDNIIRAMNRIGPASTYVKLINKIRKALPDAVLRTTFLTGFPGETEEAAENTRNFLKAIRPVWSGTFTYSREEDTPAYNLKPRIPAKTAEKRAALLQELQSQITMEQLQNFAGTQQNVLIEEILDTDPDSEGAEGLAIGRAWMQAPEVDGCTVIRYDLDDKKQVEMMKSGNVVKVKILSCTGVDLDSVLVSLEKEFVQSDIQFTVI